jgi:hypothetical protein
VYFLASSQAKNETDAGSNRQHCKRALLDLIGYFLEHITTEVRRFAANRIRPVAYTGDNSVERVADKFVDVSGSTGKFAVGYISSAVEAALLRVVILASLWVKVRLMGSG